MILSETHEGEWKLMRCDWCREEIDLAHADDCPKSISYYEGDCTCGMSGKSGHQFYDIQYGLWDQMTPKLDGRQVSKGLPHDFPEHTCRACAIQLTPWVQRFADIHQVAILTGRLQRAIYDKRKQGRA